MGEPYTIRRATAADAEDMAALRRAMQSELMEGVEARFAPEEVAELNREYFADKLPLGDFVGFLAEAGGVIVGTGGMVVYRAPPTPGNPAGIEGYIMNMYTLPEWRGRGVATAVLERLVDHARALGAARVWLRASDMGRPVYERFGFQASPHAMQLSIWPQGEQIE